MKFGKKELLGTVSAMVLMVSANAAAQSDSNSPNVPKLRAIFGMQYQSTNDFSVFSQKPFSPMAGLELEFKSTKYLTPYFTLSADMPVIGGPHGAWLTSVDYGIETSRRPANYAGEKQFGANAELYLGYSAICMDVRDSNFLMGPYAAFNAVSTKLDQDRKTLLYPELGLKVVARTDLGYMRAQFGIKAGLQFLPVNNGYKSNNGTYNLQANMTLRL